MTGRTSEPVTPVNQVIRNDDNTNDSASLQDQILDHVSSLKALIKQHNERSGTLIEPIRLSFGDEEGNDKGKKVDKGTENMRDEDLHKPFKDVLRSPFTRRIIEFSAPKHLMTTNLRIYDGSTDPDDHMAWQEIGRKRALRKKTREIDKKNIKGWILKLKIAFESGKLSHLIKDVMQRGNAKRRQQGNNNDKGKVINMVWTYDDNRILKSRTSGAEDSSNVLINFPPIPVDDVSGEPLIVKA
ncbi:hypothetical protein Tco_0088101 [Tanacetum coccineum]